ncbi:hypothetical protein L917_19522 [Phytophthora nicotianae]|uniref:Uncharacterized protein n=3 Tax=Phytophthora nicotianae TaxID=4792 RepID=V9E329_PHYNI|nr:hypothetical protein F443_20350 [Phytophthora nicotianae P1569]ETL79919.1 hypothetical protein L917_19522 [Phytophthora nicotianae]ETM33181.1 hypothetical protein L914_19557 [Phytophthora nicotianae]
MRAALRAETPAQKTLPLLTVTCALCGDFRKIDNRATPRLFIQSAVATDHFDVVLILYAHRRKSFWFPDETFLWRLCLDLMESVLLHLIDAMEHVEVNVRNSY